MVTLQQLTVRAFAARLGEERLQESPERVIHAI
jgi:hypothetical protein